MGTIINNRVINIPENQKNKSVLHPNPQFGIHNIPYDRYQNKEIFQLKDNTPSINRRIGMNTRMELVAEPCEPLNERLNNRQQGGFRRNEYEVRAGNGLTPRFFTDDRLRFTSNLKQSPQINKIY